MSMLSAQCDELRELAGDGSMEWVAGPVRASVLREAADTIWELRDDLQQANAENARLRSELEYVGIAAYLYGRDDLKAENVKLRQQLADVTESMGRVEERCAKLRELVADMYAVISRNNSWWDFTHEDTRRFAYRMHKLGVEVEP